MGLLCRGEVVPFSAVRMGVIYREIESVSRRGNLNQYWSLIRPVLVAARSSIGIYCQPVLVRFSSYIGCSARSGRRAVLFPWVSPFLLGQVWREGDEAFVLCAYFSA